MPLCYLSSKLVCYFLKRKFRDTIKYQNILTKFLYLVCSRSYSNISLFYFDLWETEVYQLLRKYLVVYITQQSFEIDILFGFFFFFGFDFLVYYTLSIFDWFKVGLNFLFLFHVRGKALSFGSSIA